VSLAPAGQSAAQLPPIVERIAVLIGARPGQVQAAIDLLDAGSTVPFIARYRKEVTGGLDDGQLRDLEQQLGYLRELETRRAAILESVRQQDKLTPELEAQIRSAESKARLEDIYLPYKPKRRTKAQIAREAGLEPLADQLLTGQVPDPSALATEYLNAEAGIEEAAQALEGARSILVERFGEHADLIGRLREQFWGQGRLHSQVRAGKEESGAKFSDYFDWAQSYPQLPSHRILAMFRGEKEEVLNLTFAADQEELSEFGQPAPAREPGLRTSYEREIADQFAVPGGDQPNARWLQDTVRWAWRTRIMVRLAVDTRLRLWQAAEEGAIEVFAGNLRDLLLAAPAGTRSTMGLDPGLRTGVKVAVVDSTGKVLETATIYPHQPANRWSEALGTLARLVRAHQVELIAIGNGTASRETDKLAAELVAVLGRDGGAKPTKVMVSEAGASVYSASAYAAAELPGLDVSLRGAVSIARRLQDPLAELVKIEPRSIGVGQYQHDLAEAKLARSLDAVVEDCVNAVGVDINTASVPLLRRVSGISDGLAGAIVSRREEFGPFRDRAELLTVPRLGPKAFEQCAGFLRIRGGENPLDQSSVHPESYPVVRRILGSTGLEIGELIGNGQVLTALRPTDFVTAEVGLPTVRDIIGELDKPGRDPRPAFATATFADGIETMADLCPGLTLEGVVTNVAAFGAFVDIGVHQDGLVHVSALSRNFVRDPREVVKPGDVVRVKVLSVDLNRKRIALTLRLDDEPTGAESGAAAGTGAGGTGAGAPGAASGAGQRRAAPGTGGRGAAPGTGGGRGGQRGGRGPSGAPAGGGANGNRNEAPGGALADAFRRAGYDPGKLG
jgi:uncharacterized protein